MNLTRRENLLRVLKGEQPEWIPIVGHCDRYNQPSKQGMDPELTKTLANVRWGDESTVVFSRSLGLDIMDCRGFKIGKRYHKVNIDYQNDAQGRVITTWQTPKGEMRRVTQRSADTNLSYCVEHEVKELDDLARLACVFEDTEYYLTPEDRELHRVRRQLIGDDGIMALGNGGTPLGQMIRVHAGVETTTYLWADARREMHALFKVMEEADRRMLDLALTCENDAILKIDDTSTTTISPDMFAEFCLGYTDRMADIVHAAGRFYFHHSCGLIRDLLPLYRQTRMDAVHGFTVPPIGNVTVAEGRKLLGPNITIISGFGSITLAVNSGKRTEATRDIATLFRDAPGNRLIMGLSAEPCNTMEDLMFIVQECRKHQRMYSEMSQP